MAEYLVELYVAKHDTAAATRLAERASRACGELSRAGRPAHWVRSIFVPEDETCFLLVEAASPELVAEAMRDAGVDAQHISAVATLDDRRLA